MAYNEDLIKLRQKMFEAFNQGLVNKDFMEATLIQVMNEAEKNRQNCVTTADNLRKQAATVDGQAHAFASLSSIVCNVLNSFIVQAEKAKQEEVRMQEEQKEKDEYKKKLEEQAKEEEKTAKKKKM